MATKLYLQTASILVGGSYQSKIGPGYPGDSASELYVAGGLGTVFYEGFTPPLRAVSIGANSVTVNLWSRETNNKANSGWQVIIEHTDGTGTVLGTLLDTTSAEMPTGVNAPCVNHSWSGTASARSISAGDRIRVRIILAQAGGTFSASYYEYTNVNGPTSGSLGDAWVQFTETIADNRSLTLANYGIASAEAMGSPGGLSRNIRASGIAGGELFGTVALSQGSGAKSITGAGSIAGGELFGTAKLSRSISGAGAIASAEVFGTAAKLSRNIKPAGLASGEAVGTGANVSGGPTLLQSINLNIGTRLTVGG